MAMIECLNCKNKIEKPSSKAKYCDVRCKSAYHRAKRSNAIEERFRTIGQALRDMHELAEQHPEFFAQKFEHSLYELQMFFESDCTRGHKWQCLRSGQYQFVEDKPTGQCDYCKKQENKIKDKDSKEQYKGDCKYVYRPSLNKSLIPTNLSDYSYSDNQDTKYV